ncbi:MAG TPA: mannitol dehydrogenase family protein [Spirochaetales bacterium]|nr:mannitol dehydrogenase family protein [Spirochaetales bacterium]HRY54653.1 mannitol dehydrogenase family protein [Spirochaetia bacterium]HRZ65637.1 mannitol dehydrogenase family protein [Spirochaetia bacterium]
MRLNDQSISDRSAWEAAGFELPAFDRRELARRTRAAPEWVHFGAGNIFRAFPAAVHQELLNAGAAAAGIVVAEGFDCEIIERAYRPYDCLSVLATLRADGSIGKKVVGSVAEALAADPSSPDWARLREAFRAPSLQLASFTITEKGYVLRDPAGNYLPDAAADAAGGPAAPRSLMGKAAALCLERYEAGALPLALVSMDNCSRNGERLGDSLRALAGAWAAAGLAPAGFPAYLADPARVAFPWTMIDKITPRPDESVAAQLGKAGLEDREIVVTARKTWTAPFVNAEEAQYLVVEDAFPNGRPPLERGGVIFADRARVELMERMKVSACLNPLHTSLAIFGCLLGFTSIHEEMGDPLLKALVEQVGYAEGLPVAADPGIVSPEAFLREVIERRFPNVFMPDTPQRIATDTSQKLAVRFGETIKAYRARGGEGARSLVFIPLVLAGWCRYLLGLDDEGRSFEPSPDPLLGFTRSRLAGIGLGDKGPFREALAPLLSDASIFGLDLCEAGLGERIEGYFGELVAGKGAVRRSLEKYLGAAARAGASAP